MVLNVASLLAGIRVANLALGNVTSVDGNADRIRSWNYGELELFDGKLLGIYPRWWPRIASEWESFRDSAIRSLPTDFCRVYYAFPRRVPGFMSVLYARSGPNTKYKTLYRAVVVMEEIARLRDSHAIVCQMINLRASERLMNRWGYVRHALALGNNHYIKRLK